MKVERTTLSIGGVVIGEARDITLKFDGATDEARATLTEKTPGVVTVECEVRWEEVVKRDQP